MLKYILSLAFGIVILIFGSKFVQFYTFWRLNDLNQRLQNDNIFLDMTYYACLVIFIALIPLLYSLILIINVLLKQRPLHIIRNSLLTLLSSTMVLLCGFLLLLVYPQQIDDLQKAKMEQEQKGSNYLWDGFEATWPLMNKPDKTYSPNTDE